MTLFFMPYDTETSGIPEWKMPSEDPRQPHLQQVAAALVDATGQIKATMNRIVKPDGWVVTAEMTKIHGITHERAMDEGVPEPEVLEELLAMHGECAMRIGHNEMFDRRMFRIAIKRFALRSRPQEERDALADWWNVQPHFDTMWASKEVMGVAKNPKLGEAFEFFTGRKLENAHDAMQDARACFTVFRHLQDRDAAPRDIEGIAAYLAMVAARKAASASKPKPAASRARKGGPKDATPAPLGSDDQVGI